MRNCQPSAWPRVATFLIKRKWPKIDRGGPRPPLRRQAVQGGSGLARHWFRGRFQASALPLVKLWTVLRSEGHPAGGVGPACRSIRGRIRASTGPLVERVLPKALLPCGGRQPSPPAVRGGIWASATPWIGCKKWGPKGSLEPAGWPPLARKSFQPSAFRILSPFSALVVYSESGAQPSAIQTLLSRTRLRAPARPGCRAPRDA